ncbi:CBS domain-containing protein [Paraburkholderia diazotrophica]|uniref:CBS domain-containing protein n=1 Tax=Paraburkholderia diazotrophica TaxID=667676 RepID=UPI0031720080
MTTVSEVMTREAETVTPSSTIREVAQLMERLDVGALPVCDGSKLKGMVTDRDIVVRAVSSGREPSAAVSEILSEPVTWCFEDDDVSVAQQKMEEAQIRRLPVVDSDKRLVGVLSLGDLAANSDANVGKTVSAVSSPSAPDR